MHSRETSWSWCIHWAERLPRNQLTVFILLIHYWKLFLQLHCENKGIAVVTFNFTDTTERIFWETFFSLPEVSQDLTPLKQFFLVSASIMCVVKAFCYHTVQCGHLVYIHYTVVFLHQSKCNHDETWRWFVSDFHSWVSFLFLFHLSGWSSVLFWRLSCFISLLACSKQHWQTHQYVKSKLHGS